MFSNNYNIKHDKYNFLHHLLDKYLNNWLNQNPDDEPFVSIKIFKYDETKMNPTFLKNVDERMSPLKEKLKEEIKEKPIKLSRKRIYKKKKKINFNDPRQKQVPNLLEVKTEDEYKEVGIEERYISDIKIDDIKFNIENTDKTIDGVIEVLNIRESPIINKKLSMILPSDIYITKELDDDVEKTIDKIMQDGYCKFRVLTETEMLLNEHKLLELKEMENLRSSDGMNYNKISDMIDDYMRSEKIETTQFVGLLDSTEIELIKAIKLIDSKSIKRIIHGNSFITLNKFLLIKITRLVINLNMYKILKIERKKKDDNFELKGDENATDFLILTDENRELGMKENNELELYLDDYEIDEEEHEIDSDIDDYEYASD
jgi:hypothetical protein